MNNYEKMMTAGGHYCYRCDRYHATADIIHRYTVQTVGEWDGTATAGAVIAHEMECPTCAHTDDLETFDPMQWTHLRAYAEATATPMTFIYPLFDMATGGPTYGYDRTASCDALERIADRYCIEVLTIGEQDGNITVTVDFQ